MADNTKKAGVEIARRRNARTTNEQEYLTRASSKATKGGLVIRVRIGQMNRWVLLRRINLRKQFRLGAWGKPLTSTVRRMMVVGNVATVAEATEKEELDTYLEHAYALIREAVVVPPPELLEGAIEIDEITEASLRPYFLRFDPALSPEDQPEKPDEDQQYLVDEETWERELEKRNLLAKKIREESDGVTEATARKWERELAALDTFLDTLHAIHWEDAAALAGKVVQKGPGALRDFRPPPSETMGRLSRAGGRGR